MDVKEGSEAKEVVLTTVANEDKTDKPEKTDKFKAWTTVDEIRFLRNIGSFSECGLPRSRLISGYIDSLSKRSVWGDLRLVALLREAREMLVEARNIEAFANYDSQLTKMRKE